MTINAKPLAHVSRLAMEILSREPGTADTIRCINQFRNGNGDYTSDRDKLFDGESLHQIIANIKSSHDRLKNSAHVEDAAAHQ